MKVKTYNMLVRYLDEAGQMQSRLFNNISKTAVDFYDKWYNMKYTLALCQWSENNG